MGLRQAKAAIRERLRVLGPQIPTRYGNAKRFVPPQPRAAWMALDFLGASPVTAGIAATGSHLHREFGTFMVHVFVAAGTGEDEIDLLCEQIANLFRVTSADGVNYDWEPREQELPDGSTDGSWYGRTVAVDFRHDWIG